MPQLVDLIKRRLCSSVLGLSLVLMTASMSEAKTFLLQHVGNFDVLGATGSEAGPHCVARAQFPGNDRQEELYLSKKLTKGEWYLVYHNTELRLHSEPKVNNNIIIEFIDRREIMFRAHQVFTIVDNNTLGVEQVSPVFIKELFSASIGMIIRTKLDAFYLSLDKPNEVIRAMEMCEEYFFDKNATLEQRKLRRKSWP